MLKYHVSENSALCYSHIIKLKIDLKVNKTKLYLSRLNYFAYLSCDLFTHSWLSQTKSMDVREENIFLFVPNIIGYFRIVFTITACYFMKSNYPMAAFWYLLSGLMDAVDGFLARLLNQTSRFGSILDQITDRCATLCLVMVLAYFYPDYMVIFQLVNIIDIGGHWIHIWSSQMMGKASHKFIDPNENLILRLYYTSRPVLFLMCAGNELFYSSLYLLHFTEGFKCN